MKMHGRMGRNEWLARWVAGQQVGSRASKRTGEWMYEQEVFNQRLWESTVLTQKYQLSLVRSLGYQVLWLHIHHYGRQLENYFQCCIVARVQLLLSTDKTEYRYS